MAAALLKGVRVAAEFGVAEFGSGRVWKWPSVNVVKFGSGRVWKWLSLEVASLILLLSQSYSSRQR